MKELDSASDDFPLPVATSSATFSAGLTDYVVAALPSHKSISLVLSFMTWSEGELIWFRLEAAGAYIQTQEAKETWQREMKRDEKDIKDKRQE